MGYINKTDPLRPPVTNKKKMVTTAFLGLTCLILVIVLMIFDPVVMFAKYVSRIANGSYFHEAMIKEIAGVRVSAYLFNITNPEQFLSGADRKLRVQEVGPFSYQELRSNEAFEIDEEAGVMRYTPRTRVVFLPEESLDHPEKVNVTMPNLAMLSVASKISAYTFIPRLGFNLLVDQLKTRSVVNMTAKDYLWGYDEPLIKLGNTIMPGLIHFETLGVLDRLYDKEATFKFEVSAHDSDKLMIKSVNSCNGLEMWDYENPNKRSICNSFNDTYEGIGYPTELTSDRPIRIYRSVLCRIMELDFYGPTTMEYGAKGLVYKISNRTFTRNKNTECLCNRGICLDGISDLSPCFFGLPVVLSNAHFLNADPKLYERVEGIKPNEEDHGSEFTIDPTMGLALTTKFSVQVNVLVKDVSFNSEAKMFSDMIVPVAYFTIEQQPITKNQIEGLQFTNITGPYIVLGMQILLAITGLLLLVYSGRLVYSNWIYPAKNGVELHLTRTDNHNVDIPLMSIEKGR